MNLELARHLALDPAKLRPVFEARAARDVTMTHADFRAVGRPPADYLRVWPLASRPTLPPGHPPLP